MNIFDILNLIGLSFLIGWFLARRIDKKEINELKNECLYYYHELHKIKSKNGEN